MHGYHSVDTHFTIVDIKNHFIHIKQRKKPKDISAQMPLIYILLERLEQISVFGKLEAHPHFLDGSHESHLPNY